MHHGYLASLLQISFLSIGALSISEETWVGRSDKIAVDRDSRAVLVLVQEPCCLLVHFGPPQVLSSLPHPCAFDSIYPTPPSWANPLVFMGLPWSQSGSMSLGLVMGVRVLRHMMIYRCGGYHCPGLGLPCHYRAATSCASTLGWCS